MTATCEPMWKLLVSLAEEALEADDKAEMAYLKAMELAQQQLGPYHTEIAAICIYLADFYMFVARPEEAESYYKRALVIYNKILGEDHMLVAMTLRNLAEARAALGRKNEAEELRYRARVIFG